MTNEQFKTKLRSLGIHLNGIFCGFDILIDKELMFHVRMRKKPTKVNYKLGEVLVIEAKNIQKPEVAAQIAKDAIETVFAMHDVLVNDSNRDLKIKEYETQIKHQIEVYKNKVIQIVINEISPTLQLQIYHKLEIKNAQRLIDGIDNVPIY